MRRILNIAHRGFSSQFPENTLQAFDEAMKVPADGFECDLQMTSDGEIVIFHDEKCDRLLGRKGLVQETSWAELKTEKVFGKEPIPHLEDLLSRYTSTLMNLEIKPTKPAEKVVEKVLHTISKAKLGKNILFSSFSVEVLEALHRLNKDRSLGRLGVLATDDYFMELPKSIELFHPETWNLPKKVLQESWKEKWKISVPALWIWTLDDPLDWKKALESELPVEAIITNKPDRLYEFLKPES